MPEDYPAECREITLDIKKFPRILRIGARSGSHFAYMSYVRFHRGEGVFLSPLIIYIL